MKKRIRTHSNYHGLSRVFVVIPLCFLPVQRVFSTAFVMPSSLPSPTSVELSRKECHHRNPLPITPFTVSPTTLFGTFIDPPSSPSSSSSSFNQSRENEANEEETENSSSSWTPSLNGGFFANIPQQIRLLKQKQKDRRNIETVQNDLREAPPSSYATPTQDSRSTKSSPPAHKESSGIKYIQGIPQVTDILQYKQQVVEVEDCDFVAVRFYAPWCKACRAVERPFRRLAKDDAFVNKAVKFVEVPVTKENAYLHQGLGIPSLPFSHIYQTNKNGSAGSTLVEEMKINKHVFGDFKQTLKNYVNGECPMTYEDDGEGNGVTR